VLDDFSRFIVAWKLCATMKAKDVTATLDLALAASGLDQMTVVHRPRLLSDNGASYVATDLAQWPDRQEMQHVRGAPYHPQTQGKIERWHQTLRNRILLGTTTCPAISNVRSRHSWLITTMPAITRAWAILPQLTSTSDEPRPSSSNAKGSSARQSQTVACSINCMPHNLNHR
jgi:transposase InsO family protein